MIRRFIDKCMDVAPGLTIVLLYGLVIGSFIGYFVNVAKVFMVYDMHGLTGEFILRGLGIIVMPLGAVAGYV